MLIIRDISVLAHFFGSAIGTIFGLSVTEFFQTTYHRCAANTNPRSLFKLLTETGEGTAGLFGNNGRKLL